MTRALVLGPGGLQGAFGGGVVATLGRELGCDYFDAVYACSAGSYTASYLASGQPDTIETIWRECLHGQLLIRWENAFRGGPILDLFYLNDVLRSARYRLAVEDLLRSTTKLHLVATSCHSGAAHYLSPRTEAEFFLQVRASAAAPYVHSRVRIGQKKFADGCLSDPLPIGKALEDGHDEVVVVCNQAHLESGRFNNLLFSAYALAQPGRRNILRSLRQTGVVTDLVAANAARVRVISPSVKSPLSWNLDSSRVRINQLVDLGIRDALAFLEGGVD